MKVTGISLRIGAEAHGVSRPPLAIGARGTSRSQTLRAFSEEEYRKIVESIP